MAEKITETKTLNIGIQYLDKPTETKKIKYVTIPNPKESLSQSQIQNAANGLIEGILLDPYGADFTDATIETAYTEIKTVKEFDLGLN